MSKKSPLHLDSKTGYDQYASFYDKKIAYLDSFEQGKLIPLLGDINNKKILDVGAGTGRLALKLAAAEANITAIDISPKILKILKNKNPHVKTVVANAESLPFQNNSFDAVTAAFLIVHLKDPKYFFAESYRVLKTGGQLLITNINQKRPPELDTKSGRITIESYYHRPEKIINKLELPSFNIQKNIFLYEKDVWINQIILAEK